VIPISDEESIFKKMCIHKKKEIILVIGASVSIWGFTIIIFSLFSFFVDINFIIALLSIEGTIFSVITAAYIFNTEFIDKAFARAFKIRQESVGDDDGLEKDLKKDFSDQFFDIVFLQYLLAFALLIIFVSLIFSITTIVISQGMDIRIIGLTNLCLFLWGIMMIMIWLLIFGFRNLPGKGIYKTLIED